MVNADRQWRADVLIRGELIEAVGPDLQASKEAHCGAVQCMARMAGRFNPSGICASPGMLFTVRVCSPVCTIHALGQVGTCHHAPP